MKKSLSISAASLAGLAAAVLLSGCVVAARAPAGGVVYVDRAPPAAYNEVVPVSPGPGHVWVGGHWSWSGREYAWARGHWVRPAQGHAHWVPGHWQRSHQGHYWVPGHWR
jgi:hypothetical protein